VVTETLWQVHDQSRQSTRSSPPPVDVREHPAGYRLLVDCPPLQVNATIDTDTDTDADMVFVHTPDGDAQVPVPDGVTGLQWESGPTASVTEIIVHTPPDPDSQAGSDDSSDPDDPSPSPDDEAPDNGDSAPDDDAIDADEHGGDTPNGSDPPGDDPDGPDDGADPPDDSNDPDAAGERPFDTDTDTATDGSAADFDTLGDDKTLKVKIEDLTEGEDAADGG
jgi:hypothetical protein